MSNDKAREEFEAWAKEQYSWHLHDEARYPEDRTLASWNGEIFGNRIVEGMWQAWQASCAAVVVEPVWPYHYNYTNSDVAGAAILDCCIAFEKAALAAGLQVKP